MTTTVKQVCSTREGAIGCAYFGCCRKRRGVVVHLPSSDPTRAPS